MEEDEDRGEEDEARRRKQVEGAKPCDHEIRRSLQFLKEKERMKFLKEMELQRMQFFVKTQLELSEIKEQGKRVGNASNDHHKSKNNMNEIVNNDVGN